MNIGIRKETYVALFGAGGGADHDFTALDQLMPHPVYGQYHWVCVLNPSEATIERLDPLLREAYDRAVGALRPVGPGRFRRKHHELSRVTPDRGSWVLPTSDSR